MRWKEQLSNSWLRIGKFFNIFVTQKLHYQILQKQVKLIYGPDKINYDMNELIVLCLVRDGEPWLQSFIEHYFSLGVKHIVFLDNLSSDNTVSLAKEYQNVTILQTDLPFKRYKLAMRQYLIKRFGKNRWSLYVDVDELFTYPFSDIITLSSLLTYLNQKSYTAVVAHMLDLFSDKPLSSQDKKLNKSFVDLHRYYDISDIVKMKYYFAGNVISNSEIKVFFGGIRKILFMTNSIGAEGLDILTKHPLVFLDEKIMPMHINEHSVRNARIADFTCALLHYKFLSNFSERVLRAVKEENYGHNSRQYKKYYETLIYNPRLQIKQETSQKLTSINELIDNGFLVVSQDYLDWVASQSAAKMV